MNDYFNEVIGHYFTKEEWALWVKGEFNLFDNYVERVGMTKEDAQRLRDALSPPKAGTTRYKDFVENPLTLPEK